MNTDLRQESSELYRELGDVYREADAVDAEVFYRRSLSLAPGVAAVHARLAATLCRLNRFGEAEEHLARARAIDPHDDEAACLWAELMVSNGRVPEAIDCYGSELRNGASPRLRTEYGDLLTTLGLLDDAEEQYAVALTAAESVEAHVNLGILHVERGRPTEALDQFEAALRVDPTSIEAALNRANALVELGRLDAAESVFATLVDVDQTRGAALWGLASVYRLRGETTAASRARLAAIAAAPSLAQACGPLPVPGPAPRA